jgi:hypothetical protein
MIVPHLPGEAIAVFEQLELQIPSVVMSLPALDWRPATVGIGSAVTVLLGGGEGVVTAVAEPGSPPAGFRQAVYSADTRYIVACGPPAKPRRRLLRRCEFAVVSR